MQKGVIIGRFQTDKLTEGHISLINHCIKKHGQPNTVILVGVTKSFPDDRDAIPFQFRKEMILEVYPQVIVLPLTDMREDHMWSDSIDAIINLIFGDGAKAILYGSRDSFLKTKSETCTYTGKHELEYFEPKVVISASERRAQIFANPNNNSSFREGLIYGQLIKPPHPYFAIDCIVRNNHNKIIIVRKPTETLYRFPGGFDDVIDESLEATVRREVSEELSDIEIDNIEYISSQKIDDWRYRGKLDKIKSVLFTAQFIFGHPKPSDDLAGGDVKWVDIDSLKQTYKTDLVPEHHILFESFIKKYAS